MNKEEVIEVQKTHDKLREVLMEYGAEFGDAIIDDICKVFDYQDNNIYYDE